MLADDTTEFAVCLNASGANISPLTPIYLKHSDEGAFVCPFRLVICQKARTERFQKGQKELHLFTKPLSKTLERGEKCLEKINFKKINNILIWRIARNRCTQRCNLLEGSHVLECHFDHYDMCPLPRMDASRKGRDKCLGMCFSVCYCEKLRAGLDSNQKYKSNNPLYTIGLRWCKPLNL